MPELTRPRVDLKVAEDARRKYREGTEYGDATMGTCGLPTCQLTIRRCDPFVVTQAGALYHTACWPQVMVKRIFTNSDGTLKASIRTALQATKPTAGNCRQSPACQPSPRRQS
jgi:hypothetical protein